MKKKNYLKRILAAVLAFVMVASGLPDMGHSVSAAESSTGNVSGVISTTDDPQTLTRPLDTYGNSTLNAGKILVGKSVTDGINDSTGEKEVLELTDEIFHMKNADGSQMELKWEPDTNNFLVTVSQSAQMYGVSSEIPIPLDVVFVLDTSGSMDQPYKVDGVRPGGATTNRAQDAVAAINETIATLMALNEYNRVSVVTFSAHNSDWDNDGMTTAGNEASSVLSPLAHYSGEAATSHLTWRGTTGNMRYLWGRNANGNVANSRNGYSGGTNIQSGMYLGAQQLLNVTDTTVVIEGKEITRMPFIIFVSDGAPVASSATNEWWRPSMTAYQGDLGNPYAGNAFLPILVASYYKQQITEKYYPDGDGAAMFYTIGVGLNSENRDETEAMSDLARMVLNPSEEFISSSGNQYYNEIERCWNSYLSGIDFEVQVDQKRTVVERDNWGRETTYTHNGYFYFHKNEMDYPNDFYMDFTENANGAGDADTPVIVSGGTKIAGNMITWNNMSLHYNDEYYDVEDSTTLAETFRQLIIEIQKRAITDPTKVNTTWGEGFSGYVTFTDIIGEYMEVKGIKGVTTGGYLYQGKTFAKLAENYTSNWETQSISAEQRQFNSALETAVLTRMNQTREAGTAEIKLSQVRAMLTQVVGTQIYYNEATGSTPEEYSNSFVWFGKVHHLLDEKGNPEEDFSVNFLEVAPEGADRVEWLSNPDNAEKIAEIKGQSSSEKKDDIYVVRSYYLYGTADGTKESGGEFLKFNIRVLRSLDEPYKQYVSISAPAELLAVQHVLIDDTDPQNLKAHSDELIPTRVTYEVGLRSDITEENVWTIVDQAYLNEYGNDNGDGSINFYTNDFKRYDGADDAAGNTGAVHDHAYTHATFDVSDSNSFYRYEKDTQLLDAAGNAVTGDLVTDATYYYRRDYYEWDASKTNAEGIAPAIQTYGLIPITLTAGWEQTGSVQKIDGYWYILEGTYTAFTLTEGDDILKSENETGSAHVVSHPERTSTEDNSHYTVWLGNNGKLTFKGVPAKTVYGYETDAQDNEKLGTANIDGQLVKVGDKLNYQIQATNGYDEATKVVITDQLPAGTELAAGSIQHATREADGSVTWITTPATAASTTAPYYSYNEESRTITWTFPSVPQDTTVLVRFDVTVTEGAVQVGRLDNQARIQMPEMNNRYSTNMTSNPVTGKRVAEQDGTDIEGAVTVGSILEYQIAYYNNTDKEATIVITDIVPEGTTFFAASHQESLTKYKATTANEENRIGANDTITPVKLLKWEMTVQPGIGGVVTFEVQVDASVVPDQGETGLDVDNYATIEYPNDPNVVTNTTNTEVKTGNLTLTKEVSPTPTGDDVKKEFRLVLTESSKKLTGTYSGVPFVNGVAEVLIKHNQTITIEGLPAGVVITVSEPAPGAGFTAAITDNGRVTVVNGTTPAAVTVTNTYDAQDTALILGGTKTFKNNDIYTQTRNFTFELKESSDPASNSGGISGQALDLVADVTLSADAGGEADDDFQFAALNYNTTGIYFYELSEQNSGMTSMTYDPTIYQLKVEVMDEDGVLKPVVSWYNNNAWEALPAILDTATNTWTLSTTALEKLGFTNTFNPPRTELTLYGHKTLLNGTLTNNQFTFKVTENGKLVVYGQNDATGKITFSSIPYTVEGTHIYTIEEVHTATDVFYGGEKYLVKVVVDTNLDKIVYVDKTADDNQENWELLSVEYDSVDVENNSLLFTNADYITLTLTGTKKLTGRKMEADEFDFIVTETVNGEEITVTSGSNKSGSHGQVVEIVFDPIGYTLADLGEAVNGVWSKTFEYEIREVNEGADNITYDQTVYEIKVAVTYDGNGWDIRVTDMNGNSFNGANFENKYTPDPIDILLAIGDKNTTSNSNTTIPTDLTFGYKVLKVYGENDTIAKGAVVATGSSGIDGKISLTDLTFIAAGEYGALLVEENAGSTVGGVKYDAVRYLIKVTVGHDTEKGELFISSLTYWKMSDEKIAANADVMDPDNYDVALSADNDAADIVFNNEYGANGYLNLSATKTITGRRGNTDAEIITYDFELINQNGTPDDTSDDIRHVGVVQMDGKVIDETTGDVTYKILFDTLTYSLDQLKEDETTDIVYIMREIISNPTNQHTDYDESEYRVTVTLPKKNELTADTFIPTYEIVQITDRNGNPIANGGTALEDSTPAFVNNGLVYHGVHFRIPVQKQLTGGDETEREFGFVLTQIDVLGDNDTSVDGTDAVEDTTSVTVTGENPFDVFLDVSVSATEKEGTYVFTLEEVNNRLGGVAYDGSVYQIRVIVKDVDNDGVLDVVHPTTGEEVTLGEEDQIPMEAMVITKIKDGNGEDTNIVITTAPVFANEYEVAPITVNLIGYKTLNGRHMKADEFDFELYEDIREAEAASPKWELKSTASHGAASDGQSAQISFAEIEIKEEGTYYYKVVERTNSLPDRVTPDTTEYYIKIVVTDDGEGNLNRTITWAKSFEAVETGTGAEAYDEGSHVIQFTNTYTPYDATVALVGTKKLTGRDMVAGEFTFRVNKIKLDPSAVDGYVVEVFGAAIGSNEKAADDAVDKNTVNIHFSKLPLAQEGTFYFQIVEEEPATSGVKTSDPVYVSVVVEKNSTTGAYDVKEVKYWKRVVKNDSTVTLVDEMTGANFINVYTPNPITTTTVIQVVKSMDGMSLIGNDFEFIMTETGRPEGVTVNDTIYTAKNDANGVVLFELPVGIYTVGGTYTYTIKENPKVFRNETVETGTANPDIIYDPVGIDTGYTVTVVVKDDGNATLTAEVQYGAGGMPTFTNVNDPVDLSVKLDVDCDWKFKKVIRDAVTQNEMALDHFEVFKFEAKDLQGNLVATGYSQADGSILFDYNNDGDITEADTGIVFTTPGIYRYSIGEADVTNPSITKDKAVWYVDIEIAKNENGALYIKDKFIVTVVDGEVVNETDITFTNIYDAEDVSVTLTANKILTGNRTDVKEGEFVFYLLEKILQTDGSEEYKLAARGTTVAGGQIVFETLTFDQVGTKDYVMVEIPGTTEGMTYSNAAYDVRIEVTEEMNGTEYAGKLQAKITAGGADYVPEQMEFVNIYKGLPAETTVKAEKILIGRPMEDGEFRFALTVTGTPQGDDSEMPVIAGSTNDADGNITFEVSNLTEAGRYTFEMTEIKGDKLSVAYSQEKFVVYIDVTDPGTGRMEAKVSYKDVEIPVFTNTYTPDPEIVTIDATKVLTGRDMKAGEFRFVIKDKDQKILATGTNDANGKIIFAEFKLTEGMDQKLYVSEVAGDDEHMTYDSTTYVLTVNVMNVNNEGELIPAVFYPAEGVVFRNEYKEAQEPTPEPPAQPAPPADNPDTGDTANIGLWVSLIAASMIVIVGKVVYDKKKRRAE